MTRRRYVFRGESRGATLHLQRCAHWVQIDAVGAEVSRAFEAGRMMAPNIGDVVIVSAADIDRDVIAACEVETIAADGTPTVRVISGELASGPVHVMAGRKARPARRPRRQAAQRPGAAIAELVHAKRLEITNRLGVLRTARKTSTERGGGCQ